MSEIIVLEGNSLETLKDLPENSVDSVCTDPPYGLSFMGKKWDYDVPSVELWREVFRVLKPGGFLLSFGGTRTYHRMVVNIEDAGFEIRDQIMWIYGSGFPKSMDVSKAIDKAAGAQREVVGKAVYGDGHVQNSVESMGYQGNEAGADVRSITAPATDDAKKWAGWGTALKPANEPIVVARKPLSESTIAKNVLRWGTGALNIDGSRIGYGDAGPDRPLDQVVTTDAAHWGNSQADSLQKYKAQGRWPANVLFDEEAAAVLDEQSGTLKTGGNKRKDSGDVSSFGGGALSTQAQFVGDSGGASRFFKVVKQDEEICLSNANTVKTTSTPLSQLADSVQSLVPILEAQGDEWLNDTLLPFIQETLNELKRRCGSDTLLTQSFVEKLKRELRLIEKYLSGLANTAEAQTPIDTITTIQNHLKSPSFVEAAISVNTLNFQEAGAKDSASRFHYVAKASKRERNAGLEAVAATVTTDGRLTSIDNPFLRGETERLNHHPTVKPVKLMEYLIKLVTPADGIVLDPFVGSGTTLVAAKNLGFSGIGIEREPEYVKIALKRTGS